MALPAYVWEAFQKLGADLKPGTRFATDEIAERLRVAPQHRRLFGRYGVLSRTELAMLAVREGWLGTDP